MARAKPGVNWFAAIVLGSVVFAVLLVLFGNIIMASLSALAGVAAGALLFPARRPMPNIVEGLDSEQISRDLGQAADKIDEIKGLCARISKPQAQKDARRVHDLMLRILDDLYKDPSDIKRARTFLAYHIDATLNVFRRYVELSLQDLRDPGLLDSLRRTEGTFNTMALAYERLLAGLLENDLMDLDVEIKTLEGAFRAEGVEIKTDGGKA